MGGLNAGRRLIKLGLMRNPLVLSVGMVLALAGCVSYFVRSTDFYHSRILDPEPEREISFRARVETIGEGSDAMKVLYTGGNPYEIGYQHGRLLRDDVRNCIKGALRQCERLIAKKVRLLVSKATRVLLHDAYGVMEPYIPDEYKEEMRGLADGAGIPLRDVHHFHAIPGLTETSCSAFAGKGRATANGELLQLRILDYSLKFGIQNYPLITVCLPEQGNAYINIGWAGFVGVVSGMNAEGIAVSEMGNGDPPGESLRGMPMIFLLKRILQYADNVEEVTGILKSAQRTNSFAYIVSDGITADGLSRIRGYILSRSGIHTYREGEVCYPWEFFPEKCKRAIPALPDIAYGSHDNLKFYRLLKANYGRLSVELFIKEINPAIAMKSNLHCVVYEPSELRAWVANAEGMSGRACNQGYVLYEFGKVLRTLSDRQ